MAALKSEVTDIMARPGLAGLCIVCVCVCCLHLFTSQMKISHALACAQQNPPHFPIYSCVE